MNFNDLIPFARISRMMVLSPDPNMIYLIFRSISQGKKAGLISLLGVYCGFFVYMLLLALGIHCGTI